jgi:LacI family transcriptional regulator
MPPRPASSLQQIARAARVSPSTVSRALRGHPLLPAATIERIRALAAEHGYRPNPIIADVMRRVRSGGGAHQLGTLAYLTFHPTASSWRQNFTYASFYEGAKQRAHDLGFALEPIWAREPKLSAARLTSILQTRGITGVIVGPRPSQTNPEILDWSQFSASIVGMPMAQLKLHQAGSHHARLLEHLLEVLGQRGYRRPGLALLQVQASRTDRGWLNTWAFHKQSLPSASRVPLLLLETQNEKLLMRWLRRYRPDVVIGLQGILDLLLRIGVRIPQDLGFANLSRPDQPGAPAGMDQKPRQIGAAAVDLVANQIFSGERGPPATPRVLLIEGEWHDGWTVR